MDFITELSEAGYDLKTPQGTTFDLADVEVWNYLGVSAEATELLVRGFPLYWEESGLASEQQKEPPELASAHRCKAIKQLAVKSTLPCIDEHSCPFNQLYKRNKRVADGYRQPSKEGVLGDDFFKGSILEEKVDLMGRKAREKRRKPLAVSVDDWQQASRQLFKQLREQPPTKLKPGALHVPEKKRLQRTGHPPRVRGAKLATHAELEPFFQSNERNLIQWGPLSYDINLVKDSHFFVVGLPRTGKTVLLRLLFQSIYRKQSNDTRFVFYDAKADLLPSLYPPEYFDVPRTQEEIDSQLYLLNPIDDRCTGWDIARDASGVGDAGEIANVLFPVVTEKDEFFAAAMQDISVAVMDALTRKSGGPHWDLYDFLCAMRGSNLPCVLSTTQRGKEAYGEYLGGTAASNEDTIKTIASKTHFLRPAAYEWRKAKHRISLRHWVDNDTKSIVLMGNARNEKAVLSINRTLLSLICKLIFAMDKKKSLCRTYMYLDEFEELGRIDSIIKAGQQGDSRYATIAMCLHDIDLFRRAYGEESEGLLSMCGFSAFLKVRPGKTADWASRVLDRQSVLQEERTTHYDEDGKPTGGHSTSNRPQQVTLVIPGELHNLPFPETSKQITGYFIAPSHPCYRGELPFGDLLAKPKDFSSAGLTLWPAAEQVDEFQGPVDSLSTPEDSFFTLHQLGFPKPGYEPPETGPEIEEPDGQFPDAPTEPEQPHRTRRKGRLKNIELDFGLDD